MIDVDDVFRSVSAEYETPGKSHMFMGEIYYELHQAGVIQVRTPRALCSFVVHLLIRMCIMREKCILDHSLFLCALCQSGNALSVCIHFSCCRCVLSVSSSVSP